jgi:hypothetical protein
MRKTNGIIKFALMIVFAFAFSSCKNNDFITTQMNDAKADVDKAAQTYQNSEIMALNLVNDTAPTYDNVIYLNKITDTLHIIFNTAITNPTECMLKIFIDYKETDYKIDNKIYTSYYFKAGTSDSIEIPFNLVNDIEFVNSHIITIAIIPDIDKYAFELKENLSLKKPVSIDYELSPPNRQDINAETVAFPPGKFIVNQFSGIMLNTDFDSTDSNTVKPPPQYISANAGETVKLAYYAGNYTNTDDLIFLVILGNSQIEINGKPFEHLMNRPGEIGYGTIEFKVPEVRGKYDVIGIASNAPYKHRTKENAGLNDCSKRFTIVVR